MICLEFFFQDILISKLHVLGCSSYWSINAISIIIPVSYTGCGSIKSIQIWDVKENNKEGIWNSNHHDELAQYTTFNNIRNTVRVR